MRGQNLALLLFILLAQGTFASAKDSEVSVPPIERCGQSSTAAFKYKYMRWDCSGIKIASMAELEALVLETHSLPEYLKGSEFRVYETRQPHFSAWVFIGPEAARYRAVFEDGQYKGVGVTTFCAGTTRVCESFETFSASTIPEPLLYKLMPPPPEAPPIVR